MYKYILIHFLFILFLANLSYAGIYNHMEVLVGEKAAGMGGAFTAIADDTTATYYNPAGIVQIPFNSMSASANAVTFKTREGKFFIRDDEKLTSFDFIPNFWGVVMSTSLGKFGFSIVVPESDNFELHEKYSDVSLPDFDLKTARYDITSESDTYLIGPSYAFSISPSLSAGISLYFLYNTFTDSIYNFWDRDIIINNISYSYSLENIRDLNGAGTGLTGKVGMLYSIGKRFKVGWVIRPPTIISLDVMVHQVTYECIKESSVIDFVCSRGYVEGTVNYKRELPYASSVGVKFIPSNRLTTTMDISYYGPAEYIEKTKIIKDFKATDSERKVIFQNVVNGNIGMEYLLNPSIPIRIGMFTDLSAAPEVKEYDTTRQPPHLDKYGITVSSGYMKSNSTVIAGIKYGTGYGFGNAPTFSQVEEKYYKKEPFTQTDIVLFISGTYMF